MKTNALIILGLLMTAQAGAQSGGNFEIVSSTIDAGGGLSTGGDFELTGTIGQPDADPQIATGGNFTLRGGFHHSEQGDRPNDLFKDSFED